MMKLVLIMLGHEHINKIITERGIDCVEKLAAAIAGV